MKRLHAHSQHFLKSPRHAAELIGHSDIKKSDLVYDIGAGSGVITEALARRVRQVIAIEPETTAATKLRANMSKYHNVTVVQKDFLDIDLPDETYKVFSNIPFHLSSKIVRKLTETSQPPASIYLIVQKQFAAKLVFNNHHFTGQLGFMLGPLYNVKIRKRLNKFDYSPPPNVDTVLVEIKPRGEALLSSFDMPAFRKLIENSFSTPRLFKKLPLKFHGLPTDIKPSQIPLEKWIEIFQATRRPTQPGGQNTRSSRA